jgi:hypothetical protein
MSFSQLPLELVRHTIFQIDSAVSYGRLLRTSKVFRCVLNDKDLDHIKNKLCVSVQRFTETSLEKEKYTLIRLDDEILL